MWDGYPRMELLVCAILEALFFSIPPLKGVYPGSRIPLKESGMNPGVGGFPGSGGWRCWGAAAAGVVPPFLGPASVSRSPI